jgi:hypothetical protein
MTPRRLLVICFWLIIVLLVIPLYVNMGWHYSMDRTAGPQNIGGADFKAYYVAAQLAREGKDFYDQDLQLARATAHGITPDKSFYIYPPLFALLMTPISAFPIEVAARVWFFFNLSLLGATLAILLLAFRIRRGVPFWVMGSLLFAPVSYSLHMGQINIVILFLLATAYALFELGHEGGVGAAIGTATILKVAPGALAAHLLWKRKYRAFLAALAMMVSLALVAATVIEVSGGAGWGSLVRYIAEVLPGLGQPRANPSNQSFNGLFSLTLLANPYFVPLIDSPALWRGMVAACTLLLVGGTIWLIPREERGTMDLEMALVVTALLPIASITWTSTLTLLLFPYAALAGRWLRRPHGWSMALGAASFALINSQRVLDVIAGWEGARSWAFGPWAFGSALPTKLPLLGTLLVWGAVALVLRMRER